MTKTPQTEPWRALPADIADLLEPELDAITDEILATIAREVPDYARPLEGSFGRGVRTGVTEALRQFVELIRSPSGARGPGREVYVALGSGELRQGRTLDALQSAYRVGARVAWRRLAAAATRWWPRSCASRRRMKPICGPPRRRWPGGCRAPPQRSLATRSSSSVWQNGCRPTRLPPSWMASDARSSPTPTGRAEPGRSSEPPGVPGWARTPCWARPMRPARSPPPGSWPARPCGPWRRARSRHPA